MEINEKKIIGNSFPISYEKLSYFLEYSKYCMCKINNYQKGTCGSGFFCKLNIKDFNNIQRPFLMTNNHVINEDYLESSNKLYIEIDRKDKILDLNNRIKLTNKENDFTIIEIKNYDKIYHFFEVSPDIFENNSEDSLKNMDIILPQFPGGKALSIGFGSILEIKDNIIRHNISTEYGSSGSPILSEKDLKLIGIHNKRDSELNENKGIFMKSIYLFLKKNNNIDMMKENIYKISDLELIKTIKCDNQYKNIILLKDGRLCSLDKCGNIKIYDKNIFNIQLEINNNCKEEIHGDIACTNDNELLFLYNDVLNIIYFTDSKNYKISQKFELEHYHSGNHDYYRKIYVNENQIMVYKNDYDEEITFVKEGNEYKIKEETIENYDYHTCDYHYVEYFKFNQWEFECGVWTGRPPPSLIFTLYKNKEKIKFHTEETFLGYLQRKQILFIEPSYIIIGDNEALLDLSNYDNPLIETFIFKNKAFKNENKEEIYNGLYEGNNIYESLTNDSVLFLGKYLIELKIINYNNNFNSKIFAKRRDITGQYFLRNEDVLFMLKENEILIYHF